MPNADAERRRVSFRCHWCDDHGPQVIVHLCGGYNYAWACFPDLAPGRRIKIHEPNLPRVARPARARRITKFAITSSSSPASAIFLAASVQYCMLLALLRCPADNLIITSSSVRRNFFQGMWQKSRERAEIIAE